MNDYAKTVIAAAIAVAITTIVYKLIPFKKWNDKKPRFTIFPKYVAKYDKSSAEVLSSLNNMKFKDEGSGVFSRGKIYGDFSAKVIKLKVEIDEKNQQVKVYASFFGILFDTGDIWQVTSEIIK